MLQKLRQRYHALSDRKKLLVNFCFYWLIWFLSYWFFETVGFFDEKRSLAYHLFHATWMATFWILCFHWSKVKAAFRKKRSM